MQYNRTMQGCQCNQAIMLVTDGAPENYKEHLEKYNLPHRPVRIFTYVIGREIIDTSATINMACENKGLLKICVTLYLRAWDIYNSMC